MKICSKCKSFGEFYKDKTKVDGFHPICKKCHRDNRRSLEARAPEIHARRKLRSKLWREANPEKAKRGIRNATLRKKYGITADDFDRKLAAQGGVCAVCGSGESRGYGTFHVDHDHDTGVVRSILCQPCNTTIGKMNNSPVLLRRLADYLETGEFH